MITHAEAQALISERLDNPLDPYINDILDTHLASCEECRAFADSSSRLASSLRTMPFLPASPVVRQNVWAAIESQTSWQQRFTGALTGQTAAIISTAAIALIVIAFSAVAITRLIDANGDDDPDARLAAGTEETLALATETTETSELTFATEAALEPTMTPEPEPTTETEATEAPTNPPTEPQEPTATTRPTELPTEEPAPDEPATEEPAPTEPPAESVDLALMDSPTPTPATDTTDQPVDLTGDSFPASSETEEPTGQGSAGFNPASLIATAFPSASPTAELPTATPVPATETPDPTPTSEPATATPEPATETPTAQSATETPVPATEEEDSSPLIEPIDGQPEDDDTPDSAEAEGDIATQEGDEDDSLTIIEAQGPGDPADDTPDDGDDAEPGIGSAGDEDDDDQRIVPISPIEGADDDDDAQELPEIDSDADPDSADSQDDDAGEERSITDALSTPAVEEGEVDDDDEIDTDSGAFDLDDAVLYSDGNPWGSPSERLGFANGNVIFSSNPDGVSLSRDDVDVQPVAGEDSQSLAICAGGDCVAATSDSGDGSYLDESIGWVDGTLIYQRISEGESVEIRAVEWDGEPGSDQEIGTIDAPVTPLDTAYPVDIGTLIPTESAWLLVSDGSADMIDDNPYGGIDLVRTNHADDLITYVAGGEIIVASASSPGTAISTIPFSGLDYDLSPDTETVAISTGSGIELRTLDGSLIGASDSTIATGSVLWRSSGIVFIDLTNDLIRLVDPADLQQ